MNTSRPLRTLLASSLAGALILQGAVAYADDTEIFFGGNAIADGIRPNVLFLLDDSGSMAWCTDSDKTDTCKTASNQRMAVLKTTMTNLLDTTSGINAGLMVLNNRTGNNNYDPVTSPADPVLSRLLFPLTHIDAPYNLKLSSPEIKVSADDASRYDGATHISDPTLLMGYIKNPTSGAPQVLTRSLASDSPYSNNNATYYIKGSDNPIACSAKAGEESDNCDGPVNAINARSDSAGNDGLLLFRNLNLPKGVTIDKVTLTLTTNTNRSARNFNVSLLNSKTPGAFNDSAPIDNNRFSASGLPSTKPIPAGFVHNLDLTAMVRTLQSAAPIANPISDLAVRLRATSNNDFSYYVGNSLSSPVLTIEYSGSEDTQRSTGLRFQTVSVPQGATITSAKLAFVPAGSDNRPVSFSVTAEASDNAAQFAAGEDFTSRNPTAATTWVAPEWRTQNPPVLNEGADVTAQVQSVVSRSGWCGNQAMAFFLTPKSGDGSRTAISQDGHNGLKPTLSVSYTGGDAGCIEPIAEVSLIDTKDDARQYFKPAGWFAPENPTAVELNDNKLPFSGSGTNSIYTKTILGARFQKLPFKVGAQVLEASVIVTPDSAAGTQVTTNVYFQLKSDSAGFTSTNDNLGSRTPLTGKTSCTFTSQGPGIPVTCQATSLASALQSVLASSNGWKDGNALSVFLAQTSASSSLTLRTYEYSPADTIRLRVKLSNGSLSDNTYKVRDHLKGLVNKMTPNNSTPIIPQLTQAAQYYTDLSDKHKGPASPIESSCQTNFLVLMTDGQANGNNAVSAAETLTGTTCTSRTNGGETCGPELANWLNKTDQSSTVPDKNLVSTHTIGFALQSNNAAKEFLADVAAAGGGKAYDASNASELAKAFNNILQEVLSTNTTFVNTTAPVNSFNRQDNKDQLYFSLFRPAESDRWVGNLKRYRFGIPANESSYAILDADGSKAINPATGFFASNTRSYWDKDRDGDDVGKGGTVKQLPAPASRKLYTYVTGSTSTDLTNSQNKLHKGTALITTTMLNDTRKDLLLDYIRGQNIDTTVRQGVGDPIHSSPRLLTYGCKGYNAQRECLDSNGQDNADQYGMIGTNEGFVQMFDTSNGQEVFGFMPEALLKNIGKLYDNAKSTDQKPHPYGMDNTVTLWVNDINRNGVIYGNPNATPQTLSGLNTGEGIYAYATMGRGGRDIYALDITNKDAPTLMWQIKGGTTTGFKQLGQTWSAPIKTKIKIDDTITDVLIFAGGYDEEQDDLNQADSVYKSTADAMGNALYIVNARTGALIWSASNVSGHSVQLAKMKYSIPSTVRAIDLQQKDGGLTSDPEQLADQIFFGDMGGQVWRFFINNGSSGAALVSPGGDNGDGVFASLGGSDPASARRFYHEPDVSIVRKGSVRNLTVSIGSGYRGHPLNKFITDRFYSLRTTLLTRPDGANAVNEGTLTEGALYDATSNQVQSSNNATRIAAEAALSAAHGWYITLAGSGEKVLSRALTVDGNIFVNTYEPSSVAGQCKASVGRNRSYAMKLADASPITTEVGSNATYTSRFLDSNGQGLGGDPQLFCQGGKCYVIPDPSLDPIPTDPQLSGPLYWSDSLNSN